MRAIRPLRHPAYRWLAGNLAFSVLAEGLWVVALVWQVVALGGGPAQLSVISAALAVGVLVTALPGGVLADRVPQRRILVLVAALQAGAVGVVAALSVAGLLGCAALTVAALLIGVAGGLMFPAYSALVPRLVPADELQAVNGLEGMLRPALLNAGGPALAGVVVAAAGPGPALAVVAAAAAAALVCAVGLPRAAPPAAGTGEESSTGSPLADLREGLRYMLRTRWLLVTLLFASAMILVVLGPMEVLVPFAVKDRAGGGPAEHAFVLAMFGLGGFVGSFLAGSMRPPRRYLTAMISVWAVGCLPMAVFGLAGSLAPMAVAAFVVGVLFNAPQVLWGTLLQRRVPRALLGRVSSLDFFVSLAFMPVSMALAGPVSTAVGLTPVFLVAGIAPVLIGAVALLLGRLGPDELAHPMDGLDGADADADGPATVVAGPREEEVSPRSAR
ncbi:MFS transporter [Actinomycetospora soli]|uniref:MFS transporter n=1 Tax=Actinomycetospora soli TaxID=2893887 RepID=UPI001E5472A9|nr:MFS transporter [Actinomycetospora soli]MCD2188699.1 MFS transporter [Actinomycetospora soli]